MEPPPPAPSAARSGVELDALALARLRELDPDGRAGVIGRVLQAFETSLSRMLAQMADDAQGRDPDLVSRLAHTLKSSSASVGALALARTCAEIENRLRGADPTDAAGLAADVERLRRAGDDALQAVRLLLRG